MNEISWQRARKDEQIEQRVQAILDAAGKVFQKEPYEKVTMQMIAMEAEFTRSNLYRYFKTREEIFLALFMSDADKWAHQVISAFTQKETPETFVKKWTEILCRQKRLLELSPLLSLSLEKNTSENIYRYTKLALSERMSEVVPALQKALPSLTAGQFFEFLLTHQALLAGAWPMTQYSEMQNKVLDEIVLPHFKIDFATFYEKAILMYLRGVISNTL
jgi:TetR/AcrR family transcriptional regulator